MYYKINITVITSAIGLMSRLQSMFIRGFSSFWVPVLQLNLWEGGSALVIYYPNFDDLLKIAKKNDFFPNIMQVFFA